MGPEGQELEDALKNGDATSAVNAAARLTGRLEKAKQNYLQKNKASKSREHDVRGYELLAAHLLKECPGKTDNDRWNVVMESADEIELEEYAFYRDADGKRVVQYNRVTRDDRSISRSRFQDYQTEASKQKKGRN